VPSNYSSARLKYRKKYNNQKITGSNLLNDYVAADVTSNSTVSEDLVSTGSAVYDDDITNNSSFNHNSGWSESIFNFSHDNILSGIIFSEILGRPRAKRSWRNR